MSKTRALVMALLMALVSYTLWAAFNRPQEVAAWPAYVQGFAFSPVRAGQIPNEKRFPSIVDIDRDLALLAGKVGSVRTYSVEDSFAEIPALAQKRGLAVTLGVWLSGDLVRNEMELARAIDLVHTHKNIARLIVGNEVLLRGELTEAELVRYLERARKAVKIPVSTADIWSTWLSHPVLARHVDFIAAHVLPYWEGMPVEQSVEYVVQRHQQLRAEFPRLPILLAEVGWPSKGRTRYGAVASAANEAVFLREFLARAQQEGYTYYLMEAFDQPWKRAFEGDVGAYWGVYDVERRPKFPFTGAIVPIPHWPLLAGAAATLGFLALLLLALDGRAFKRRGIVFLGAVALAAATALVWIVDTYADQYWTPLSIGVGVLFLLSLCAIVAVLLAEAHEWAESLWVSERRRELRPLPVSDAPLPKVSIHVATYNEPPAMVIETLNALARLDYPDYEVLLIDNNTRDPALWQPVEAHCAQLGAQFRFFHIDRLAGYKAGALNFALRHTAQDAQIVAVVDSDYTVNPEWLQELVPQFAREKTAIVQAPQDYRDAALNPFKAMCYQEYQGFFRIGMVTRNDRNAIIQHGTMTLIRRSVLEQVGAWGEWCITEDAELGLRVFERGYEAVYTPRSYGKGFTPDTFIDYKKQRYRWVYGAMQILRRHARGLLTGAGSGLNPGQRYHFVAGWLPWLADGVNFFFTLAALAWAAALLYDPVRIDPPMVIFALPPLALFAFKLVKLLHLYRRAVGAGWRETISAALAGLALSHAIAKAVILGALTRNQPFICTPKMKNASALSRALLSVPEELVLLCLLWGFAGAIYYVDVSGSSELKLFVIVMLVQSLPYLAAVCMALVSALPQLKALRAVAPSVLPASAEGR
jgi:exo-beta-1,3-glucanase (GH17 family)/cellulose synthase/poly-beta-1,6-N-acetylglucosamine synthase-like glycosyltransferase